MCPPFASHPAADRKAGSGLYNQRMPFTFEWATCGWGICLLKAGRVKSLKAQESVAASWANASGWELQSVIFALVPASSAQPLHRSKAHCLIMVIWPYVFTTTLCLLTSSWCARPGLYSCFCYGIPLTQFPHPSSVEKDATLLCEVCCSVHESSAQGRKLWEGRTQCWPAAAYSVLLCCGYRVTAVIRVR